MGRSFKRKTPRMDKTALANALEIIENNPNASLRAVAREFKLCESTLRRHKKNPIAQKRFMQVFTEEQEETLKQNWLRCAAMYSGLTTKSARLLAYQYAESISIRMPNNWKESKCAGIEWLRAFRLRHPELTLRHPLPSSIACASSLNDPLSISPDYNHSMQDIAPYPRAPSKFQSTKGRTIILTELEDEQTAVVERKSEATKRKLKAVDRKVKKLAENLTNKKDEREDGPSSGEKATRGRPMKNTKHLTPSAYRKCGPKYHEIAWENCDSDVDVDDEE